MMRAVNKIVVALIAAGVVIGPLALLALTVRSDHSWLLEQLAAVGESAGPSAVLPLLGVAAIAAIWLLATTLIVRAAARQARQAWRRMRHLPLPSPAQAAAGSLAGAALLSMPTLVATADQPPTPVPAGAGTDGRSPSNDAAGRAESIDGSGVELPGGGWLPTGTARDVAAVVGVTWLRRRYLHDPDSASEPAPLLPAVANAAAAHATDTQTDPVSADHLPAGLVALTGPGRRDALRGVLVTALLNVAANHDDGTHVVIMRADLARLLNTSDVPQTLPGLRIANNATAEARVLAETQGGSGRVVCIDLSAAVAPPAELTGLTVVTTGETTGPAARTWTVAADGTVATDGNRQPARLCVLPAQSAVDLIRVTAHAYGLRSGLPVSPAPTPPAMQRPRRERPAPARLEVLGACRLTVAQQPVTLHRSAAWQVLVLLAVTPGGATARQLTGTIWPGLAPTTITSRLYTTLSHIRGQTRFLLNGADMIS
ncbi:hypothetical protein AB0M20_39050, partial [Actinoplanes sp. NPDC051633]|uniref:hypothetical protein n=1 Tax=Actinoplanes sp. NPDC051633 TaxID=3155670 RepID=UPI00342BC840